MPNNSPRRKHLPALLALLTLVWLVLLGWQLFTHAPVWHYQQTLRLEPVPGKVWKLGYSELGQHNVANAADHQHVQLRYDNTPPNSPKGWMLANLSASKGLLYQYNTDGKDTDHHRLRQWALSQGDEIHLDQVKLTVQTLDAEHLVLEAATPHQRAEWQTRWAGFRQGILTVAGAENFVGCEDGLSGFYLGGDVQCNTRWRIAGLDGKSALPPKAASIVRSGGVFVLRPHDAEMAFRVVRAGVSTDLMAMEVPLVMGSQHMTEIIVGKTTYKTTVDGKTGELRLTASRGIHLFDAVIPEVEKQVGELKLVPWQAEPAQFWLGWGWVLGLGGMALFSLLLAYITALDQQLYHQPARVGFNLLLLVLPLLALGMGGYWANHLPHLSSVVAITWVGLTGLLWQRGMLSGDGGWVWLWVLLLAGIGLLVQMQLAVGADNSKWQRFASVQAFSLLGMAWFITVLALFPAGALARRWEAWVTTPHGVLRPLWLGMMPTVLVLALLGLLKVSGGEGGVHGFQPAELAKLVMALLLAVVVVTWVDLRTQFADKHQEVIAYRGNRWRLAVRLFMWVVSLAVLATVILTAVRDFSPALILFLLMFGFVWGVRLRLPKRWRAVVYLVPVLVVGVLWAAWQYPVWFAHVLADLQGERFLVWVNPWAYPDLGLQAQRSLEAIHSAGWWRWDWFGNNGGTMAIPAVQNDFILAFVLARVGALGGLVLLLIQLVWVGLLFGLHQHLLATPAGERGTVRAVQLLAWLLYGLAWLQMTHWLISWGNVLGLLPIMGQPMTWVSSGNSHLLALGLPSVLLALLAVRVLQVRGDSLAT